MRGKQSRPARLNGVAEDNSLMTEVVADVEIEMGGIFFVGKIILHKNSTKNTHTQLYTIYNLPISNIVFELN